MAGRLFGTDGVRGVANESLTPELTLRLGAAAALVLRRRSGSRRVVIGRDTRISGQMLESALAAGMASMGAQVYRLGVVPTPGVAQITRMEDASVGAVISASHNPFEDNGIKFFGADGRKLPDSVEDEIEAAMEGLPRPTGADLGHIVEQPAFVEDYLWQVRATFPSRLDGLKLVLDCANGAAYEVAPRLFAGLGAEVVPLCVTPDGVNINMGCGSTKPQSMQAVVKAVRADAGLAFDGDADRVLLADERGELVDGDRMMAVCALHMASQDFLPGNVVVATVMSNAGLEQALKAKNIRLHRADVGDRYVAEAMEKLGAAIGGEQSGHILFPRLTPTGDGMVTALQVLAVMRATGKPLSELAGVMETCPQVLKNVRVRDRQALSQFKEDAELQRAIAAARERLGVPEWLSVRASGTEPLIRVMAQGTDADVVHGVVEELVGLVTAKYGA